MRDKSEILNEIKTRQKLRWNDHLINLLYSLERDIVMDEKKVLYDEGGYINAEETSVDSFVSSFTYIENLFKKLEKRISSLEKKTELKSTTRSGRMNEIAKRMYHPTLCIDKEAVLEDYPIQDRVDYLHDELIRTSSETEGLQEKILTEYYNYQKELIKKANRLRICPLV